jgi:hypothetical protein
MGKWLSALRAAEKQSENAPNVDLQNLQNPPKAGFEGFEGYPPSPFPDFQGGWDEADWHFAYEERAAILEHDEGLPRIDAEALAAEQIATQRRRLLQ